MANAITDAPVLGIGSSLILAESTTLVQATAKTALGGAGAKALDLISEALVCDRPLERMENVIGERTSRDTDMHSTHQMPGGTFSFRPRLAQLATIFKALTGDASSPYIPVDPDPDDATTRELPALAIQVVRHQGTDAEIYCGMRLDELTWSSEGAKEVTVEATVLGSVTFTESSPNTPSYTGVSGVTPIYHSMLALTGDVAGLKPYKFKLHAKNNSMTDGIANAAYREHFVVGEFESDLEMEIPVNPIILGLWDGWYKDKTVVNIVATYQVSESTSVAFSFNGQCITPKPNVQDRAPQRKTIQFRGCVATGTPNVPALTITVDAS